MTRLPHFGHPFRFENGRAVVVEQNSLDDVATCVETIVRYRQGDRIAVPNFGIDDLTFTEGDLDLDAMVQAIERWEERVDVLISEAPDRFDELVRFVRVQVTRGAPDG